MTLHTPELERETSAVLADHSRPQSKPLLHMNIIQFNTNSDHYAISNPISMSKSDFNTSYLDVVILTRS
jgi:hypothetical protein